MIGLECNDEKKIVVKPNRFFGRNTETETRHPGKAETPYFGHKRLFWQLALY